MMVGNINRCVPITYITTSSYSVPTCCSHSVHSACSEAFLAPRRTAEQKELRTQGAELSLMFESPRPGVKQKEASLLLPSLSPLPPFKVPRAGEGKRPGEKSESGQSVGPRKGARGSLTDTPLVPPRSRKQQIVLLCGLRCS